MIKEKLGAHAIPIQFPSGEGELFTGVVDLITRDFRVYHDETLGATYTDFPIPKDLLAKAKKYREELLEAISEYDDILLEKFLEGKEPEIKDMKRALRKATLKGKLFPVLCGAAFKNKGVQKLLDAIVDFLPSPLDLPPVQGINPKTNKPVSRKVSDEEPFSALAFKIVSDPFVGKLTYLRIYSGKLKTGAVVLNADTKTKERIGRILQMHANKREDVEEVFTGDICAAVGLKSVSTGHTLCALEQPIVLEKMKFPEPVIFIAIEPKTKTDQDKLADSLNRLSEEDPTFKAKVNEETGQIIISGMGELHLEILVERMLREFGVKANVGKPQVAYKETITVPAETEGRFIRQTGGRGLYGVVKIRIEPIPPEEKLVFENKLKSARIPKEFIPAIEKGIKEAMTNGVLAGYPMVGVKVVLLDGKYHEVDSNELAYKVAGSMALQEAAKKGEPKLLEPIMDVEIIVPEEYMGDIIGDLNARRGKIQGIFARIDAQVISATVPLAEMFGYATNLRSLSQGRAVYTMEFVKYDFIPDNVSEGILSRLRGF
jgi:elongation factor G